MNLETNVNTVLRHERPAPTPDHPTTGFLADVSDVLDAHGYQRAPGCILSMSLPRLDQLFTGLTATYEVCATEEMPGA